MTSDTDLPPGQWLRLAREQAGYRVAARFAEAIGVAPAVLSTYERDKVRVPDDTSERIATSLRRDIIEVRRRLGLWVPDGIQSPEADVGSASNRDLLAELSRRLGESVQFVDGQLDELAQVASKAVNLDEPDARSLRKATGS